MVKESSRVELSQVEMVIRVAFPPARVPQGRSKVSRAGAQGASSQTGALPTCVLRLYTWSVSMRSSCLP